VVLRRRLRFVLPGVDGHQASALTPDYPDVLRTRASRASKRCRPQLSSHASVGDVHSSPRATRVIAARLRWRPDPAVRSSVIDGPAP
jgi:hypothetical protein